MMNTNTMDAVIQFFKEKWPVLTIAVLVLIAAVWLTMKITKRIVRADYLEERCKGMPCEEHTVKIDTQGRAVDRLDARFERVENRLERVESIVQDIKVEIVSLQTFLQSKYKTAAPLFSQKHSPRTLNVKGREVFDQFGGKTFLDENEELLCRRISDKQPKTALDVEQDALGVLYETMDLDIFNEVKLKVYNSEDISVEVEGREEKYSITMGDICFIFSLELRDRYLAKHPEVPQG